jgi:putative salt-induced outer membrane protein YdiY
MKRISILFAALVIACAAHTANGQTTPPAPAPAPPAVPPPVWSGNVAAGLALTSGNTETKNINLSLGVVRDPKKRSVLRLNGLYLHGAKSQEVIVNQATFTGRDEVTLSTKTFVFVQGNYVKDTFKGIRYLFSPTGGFGYKFVNTDTTFFGIDTGVGGVWESDLGTPSVVTGAYNAGERFSWKVSKTATITQSIASLWKTNDWADSLHTFSAGLAASITAHSEVKIELLDSFKNRPPVPLKKNDTSLITALVWKF